MIGHIVDDSDTIVEARHYDPFGNMLVDSPNLTEVFAQSYTGLLWDGDVSAYQNRARWYDPSTGRFLSTDSLGFAAGDPNLYRYCSNNPTNLNDPSGHVALGPGMGSQEGVDASLPKPPCFGGFGSNTGLASEWPWGYSFTDELTAWDRYLQDSVAAASDLNAWEALLGNQLTLPLGNQRVSLTDLGGIVDNWDQNFDNIIDEYQQNIQDIQTAYRDALRILDNPDMWIDLFRDQVSINGITRPISWTGRTGYQDTSRYGTVWLTGSGSVYGNLLDGFTSNQNVSGGISLLVPPQSVSIDNHFSVGPVDFQAILNANAGIGGQLVFSGDFSQQAGLSGVTNQQSFQYDYDVNAFANIDAAVLVNIGNNFNAQANVFAWANGNANQGGLGGGAGFQAFGGINWNPNQNSSISVGAGWGVGNDGKPSGFSGVEGVISW